MTGIPDGLNSAAITAVETSHGVIKCDAVVVGAGPWTRKLWKLMELPSKIDVKGRDGKLHLDVPMWTYWCLEEGTLGVDPKLGLTNDGKMGPVHSRRHRCAALFRCRRLR